MNTPKEKYNYTYIKNIEAVKNYFTNNSDFVIKEICGDSTYIGHLSIIHIKSVVDIDKIENKIINPLTDLLIFKKEEINSIHKIIELLKLRDFETIDNINKIFTKILEGNSCIIFENTGTILALDTAKKNKTNLVESKVEPTVKGSKLIVTNDLNKNIGILKEYIKSEKLMYKSLNMGNVTNTKVAVLYIKDICEENTVNNIMNDLKNIQLESILDINYIEQKISSQKYSIFPQILTTERIDRTVGNLMEGRAAIIIDGTSFVGILPITVAAFFQTPEDYYLKSPVIMLLRLLRYVAFIVSCTATPLYIAISSFHYEVIPYRYIIPFAESIAPIPFPPLFEAILLEFFGEILRESSSRTYGAMGSIIGILGAILVGQAAIQAYIVSPAMVITIAMGIICSYAIPNYDYLMISRSLKFISIAFVSMFGGVGLAMVLLITLLHLCSLEFYGIPYLSGIAPFHKDNVSDILYRPESK